MPISVRMGIVWDGTDKYIMGFLRLLYFTTGETLDWISEDSYIDKPYWVLYKMAEHLQAARFNVLE